jgi:hypothetical protein
MIYKKRFKINNEKLIIDFNKMVPLDGFITSKYSPFNKFFTTFANSNINLNNSKTYIFTNNNPIDYKKYVWLTDMRRFYHYFFKKMNSRLIFFGSHGCAGIMKKCDRIEKIFTHNGIIEYYDYKPPLLETDMLQIKYIKTGELKNIIYDLSNM